MIRTPTTDARQNLMDRVLRMPLDPYFERATLKLAEPLATRDAAWREPLAWFRDDAGHDNLQGEYSDATANVTVSACLYTLLGETAMHSNCSCGASCCMHAAALLLRLQQLRAWPRAMTPLQRWLHTLDDVDDAPKPALAVPEAWQPVCLLQLADPHTPARLAARLLLTSGDDWREHPQCRHDLNRTALVHAGREVLTWHAMLRQAQHFGHGRGHLHLLDGHLGAELLDELLAAGCCYWAPTLTPLQIGPMRSPAWRWVRDGQARSRLSLHWPGADDGPTSVHVIELRQLRYVDVASGHLGHLDLPPETLHLLTRMPPVPLHEIDALRTSWPPHALLADLPLPPPSPPIRHIHTSPRMHLVLSVARREPPHDHVMYVGAFADYAGHRLPLAQALHQTGYVCVDSENDAVVTRDTDGEARAQHMLKDAGFVTFATVAPDWRRAQIQSPSGEAWAHRQFHLASSEHFVALDAILQRLAGTGFVIEHDPDLPFILAAAKTPLTATLDADPRPGWCQFELATDVEGEQIDVLPIVLGGLARRAFTLTPCANEPPDAYWPAPYGPGRWLPLPLAQLREWIAPLVECLDDPRQAGARRLRVSRSQAALLAERLPVQGVMLRGNMAENMVAMLGRLRDALKTPPAAPPHGFCGTLRDYQKAGLHWLQALRASALGGVLADDMGLGKTVQIIAHLLVELESGRLDRPALVVAPTSLIFNWMDEAARFAPALRCLALHGPSRATHFDEIPQSHMVVTSYALVAHDLEHLQRVDYALLVLDEAQWIKNPGTQAARAVRQLRAGHRLAVTGTPLENHLGELWAHFDAVLPGYLGDRRLFRRVFRQPIEKHEDDERLTVLRQRIAPFLLRRTKDAVAPELPPRIETVVRVAMGEAQRRLYESLRLSQSRRVREALAEHGLQRSRILVISALLRMRQVCCDPRLLDTPSAAAVGESAKLDALLERLHALRDDARQVLVFSQFTSMLTLIAERLEGEHLPHTVLTGDTIDRATPVRRFQNGEVPILLASLKAGGVGLNLTAADAVIHYDPWWNPAAEAQATDRAHRLGREQPVFIYKLLCSDTIEERMEAMKQHKSDLAETLFDASRAPASLLDPDAIRHLFDIKDDTPIPTDTFGDTP